MHRNTKEVDALVSIKFGKALNIAGQREYDIWCCSLRALVPDREHETRVEKGQTCHDHRNMKHRRKF
jgi:hypothetical protein